MDSSMLEEYDEYEIEEDSDQESVDSSEDEIHQFLHGTPEQKRRIRRRSLGKESSSEDEFEKEMNMELDETLEEIERKRKEGAGPSDTNQQACYDDIYFDSDEEENKKVDKGKSGQNQHPVLSNDDLLYDPTMDDEDQKWVDRFRERYQPRASKVVNHDGQKRDSSGKKGGREDGRRQCTPSRQGVKRGAVKPLPKSDAVLNCPACMTTLCLDCQRHELYKEQYRAMFVMNCKVDKTEVLRYPKSSKITNISRKRKKKQSKPERLAAEQVMPSVSKPNQNIDNNSIDSSKRSKCTTNDGSQQTSHYSAETASESAGNLPKQNNSTSSGNEAHTLPCSTAELNIQGNISNTPMSSNSAVLGGVVNEDDVYYPVKCSECNTEVGVFDQEEIFHFFNVLASYS